MSNLENYIGKCYDKIAKRYICSINNKIDENSITEYMLLKFANYMNRNSRVYDVGCGNGYITKFLKDNKVNIKGIDISKNMIREARLLFPNVNFNYGNLFNIKIRDNSLDGILSHYSLINYDMNSIEKAFKEFKRILKSNGLFLYVFHVGKETLFLDEFFSEKIKIEFVFLDPDRIIERLKANDFSIEDVVIRYPKNNEFMSKRAFILAKKR
jgi:ubiquinone/menaquinone biosynthesis C-methylase UbiE